MGYLVMADMLARKVAGDPFPRNPVAAALYESAAQ
jgi:hypothetical protein